jgi:hypothetical protein
MLPGVASPAGRDGEGDGQVAGSRRRALQSILLPGAQFTLTGIGIDPRPSRFQSATGGCQAVLRSLMPKP